MKRLVACLVIGLLAVGGCKKKSEPGGGSDKADQFSINVPRMATSIKQGETKAIDIEISRGDNMKSAVTLSFEPPDGVTVKPKTVTVASGETKTTIDVTVDKKTETGEKTIKVVGTPEKGDKTSVELKINVKAR